MMRLVQRFQASKKHEFVELEKQFAELEARGILPKGERLLSLSGRNRQHPHLAAPVPGPYRREGVLAAD